MVLFSHPVRRCPWRPFSVHGIGPQHRTNRAKQTRPADSSKKRPKSESASEICSQPPSIPWLGFVSPLQPACLARSMTAAKTIFIRTRTGLLLRLRHLRIFNPISAQLLVGRDQMLPLLIFALLI